MIRDHDWSVQNTLRVKRNLEVEPGGCVQIAFVGHEKTWPEHTLTGCGSTGWSELGCLGG